MKKLFGALAVLCSLPVLPANANDQMTCEFFMSRAEAQAVFSKSPRAFSHLDADSDGLACEHLAPVFDRTDGTRISTASHGSGWGFEVYRIPSGTYYLRVANSNPAYPTFATGEFRSMNNAVLYFRQYIAR